MSQLPAIVSRPSLALVPIEPAAALGLAFARQWHERSAASERHLSRAVGGFVARLRAKRLPPEASVIAFKEAVHHFGGVHATPGLTLDHQVDGEACASAYARAFRLFVDAYFAPAASR